MTSHWLLLLRHLNDPERSVDPMVVARAAVDIVLNQKPRPTDVIEAIMSTAAITFATAVTAVQARRALAKATER